MYFLPAQASAKQQEERMAFQFLETIGPKTLIWFSQLSCSFRARCIFALPFAALPSDVQAGPFLHRKIAWNSKAALGVSFHFKIANQSSLIWHCLSWDSPVLDNPGALQSWERTWAWRVWFVQRSQLHPAISAPSKGTFWKPFGCPCNGLVLLPRTVPTFQMITSQCFSDSNC